MADFPHREKFLRGAASFTLAQRRGIKASRKPRWIRCTSERRRRNIWAPLKAIPLVRVVRDAIHFVSTQLFVRLKRLAAMVTLKRTRRLISPDVSPDFRVGDSF
jgi:hypothetical protein